MSTIRRQSIISSIIVYLGFGVGLVNIYLFTRQGLFLEQQFGLYNVFIAIATMMMAFSSLAMPTYIYKFYPYYKQHLPPKKNDLLSIALTIAIIGFALVILAGIVFKDLVVRKYITNAPEIVRYYEWIFPLGFGLLIYTVLEAYAWQLQKSVVANFLREVMWRLFTTVLIVLFLTGVIGSFDLFIKLFSFSFPFIALLLLVYLLAKGQIHFTLKISKVTRRYFKNIMRLTAFVYTGSLIFTLALIFDSLVISSVLDNALTQLAVYSVAQNVAALIQAPQRGVVSASIAHLSQAWKDKNLPSIQRIYQRSSINQLIFACGLFLLIFLNFTDAVNTFKLKGTYIDAYYVVMLLGLTKIVDMGTGVNAQIIGTSVHWRFEMISGMILLCLMLPLSYFMTKSYGIVGAGGAQLISISIYNSIRMLFLWRKFRLYPFSRQTLFTLIIAVTCYGICYFVFLSLDGWTGLIVRSMAFVLIYTSAVIYFKLSPDVVPVLSNVWKKITRKL